jgi:hypothetical protein
MRRVAFGLLGVWLAAAACGGSTKEGQREPNAAGSLATAGSTTAGSSSDAGGAVGGAAAAGAKSPGEGGQAGASSPPLGEGIAPEALEGCRGPGDTGCDFCFAPTTDGGDCVRYRGATDYVDFQLLGGQCPVEGPFCARCSYADERRLRELEASGCVCGTGTGTAPCMPGNDDCGCRCNQSRRLHEACPATGSQM